MPTYELLRGRVSVDGLSTLVYCKGCGEVHRHPRNSVDPTRPVGDSSGYKIAPCGRSGYAVEEVGRFGAEQDELSWIKAVTG